jgi:hypothetical protein
METEQKRMRHFTQTCPLLAARHYLLPHTLFTASGGVAVFWLSGKHWRLTRYSFFRFAALRKARQPTEAMTTIDKPSQPIIAGRPNNVVDVDKSIKNAPAIILRLEKPF